MRARASRGAMQPASERPPPCRAHAPTRPRAPRITARRHFLFSYFTSLVDAYSKCLAPQEELKQRLLKESDDRLRTLTRIQQYASFVRERDRAASNKRAVEDAERTAMLTIDWHDFVVVETIGFDDEESLPKPQVRVRV